MQKLTLMFGLPMLLYMVVLPSGQPTDGESSVGPRTECEGCRRDCASLSKPKNLQDPQPQLKRFHHLLIKLPSHEIGRNVIRHLSV
ncbi:hypothetical protein FNV43_RR13621 [Rhamnella rubrinervis]|uniref:Uncharacterized protein n=1 Tax=Rhamnella rubrinervis TaxID=2594499 RepID=A0A8K0MFE3_9ROSA|nr:hypothetical protein FNV43_RR13621 [Rhamnella rubrinervis]